MSGTKNYEFAIWTKGKKGWRKEEYVIIDALTYEEAVCKLENYAIETYGCWIPIRACLRTGIESFVIEPKEPFLYL